MDPLTIVTTITGVLATLKSIIDQHKRSKSQVASLLRKAKEFRPHVAQLRMMIDNGTLRVEDGYVEHLQTFKRVLQKMEDFARKYYGNNRLARKFTLMIKHEEIQELEDDFEEAKSSLNLALHLTNAARLAERIKAGNIMTQVRTKKLQSTRPSSSLVQQGELRPLHSLPFDVTPEEYKQAFSTMVLAALGNMMEFVEANALQKLVRHFLVCEMPDEIQDLADLLELFLAIDEDGNGTITAAELQAAFERHGSPLDMEELQELMQHLDTGCDGTVSKGEFVAATLSKDLLRDEDILRKVFKKIDKNDGGSLSERELNWAITRVNIKTIDAKEVVGATGAVANISFNKFCRAVRSSTGQWWAEDDQPDVSRLDQLMGNMYLAGGGRERPWWARVPVFMLANNAVTIRNSALQHPEQIEMDYEDAAFWDCNVLDLTAPSSRAVLRVKDESVVEASRCFHVEALVRLPQGALGDEPSSGPIVSKASSRGAGGWELRVGARGVEFMITLSKRGEIWQERVRYECGALPAGTWFHVAGAFNGQSAELYVHYGSCGWRLVDHLQRDPRNSTPLPAYKERLTFGHASAPPERKLRCELAAVRIVNGMKVEPSRFLRIEDVRQPQPRWH